MSSVRTSHSLRADVYLTSTLPDRCIDKGIEQTVDMTCSSVKCSYMLCKAHVKVRISFTLVASYWASSPWPGCVSCVYTDVMATSLADPIIEATVRRLHISRTVGIIVELPRPLPSLVNNFFVLISSLFVQIRFLSDKAEHEPKDLML